MNTTINLNTQPEGPRVLENDLKFTDRRCINFDIYDDRADKGVQTELDSVSVLDEAQECPLEQLHTVTFRVDGNESMLRTSIEDMLVNVEWESLTSCYKSHRELDPPFVVKVVQPILTIEGGCTVPVEVPAGLHGVV